MKSPTITIEVIRLSVEIAEILIRAEFDADPGPDCELRGRLMGPRCPGFSTIEIAYPVKPLPCASPTLRMGRVIIPEPNLWTETKPLTYWGPIELWNQGNMVSWKQVEVGLRKSVN
jgi:hypothetical protein